MDQLQEEGNFLGRWLNDNLDAKELADFKHSQDYSSYEKIIQTLEEFKAPDFETENSLEKLKHKIEQAPKSKSNTISLIKKKPYLLAATISLILGITYVLFYANTPNSNQNQISYTTSVGEKHAIEFPDGSEVKINVASQLNYNLQNWTQKRIIRLDGEAFFKVTPGKPFLVETSKGSIEVLGTSFNVKARKNIFEVVCYSGKVNVKGDSFEKTLLPGEGIKTQDNKNINKLTTKHLHKSPSWLKGISSLDNVPLSEALEELCFYFDLKISSELDLSQYYFTGDFPHADLNLSIKLLVDPFNQLNYTYDAVHKTLTIVSND